MSAQNIEYICQDCRESVKKPNVGFHAVNEVGRKSCGLCGDNSDTLNVITEQQFEAFKKTRENK